MNMHGVVRGVITAVNPEVLGTLHPSTGTAIDSVGRRSPTYAAPATVMCQVQDLSQRDIMHLASLNVQGSQKTVYLRGQISGLSRTEGKSGDYLDLPDGKWLVTAVLEQWPDWARVAVTKQLS